MGYMSARQLLVFYKYLYTIIYTNYIQIYIYKYIYKYIFILSVMGYMSGNYSCHPDNIHPASVPQIANNEKSENENDNIRPSSISIMKIF